MGPMASTGSGESGKPTVPGGDLGFARTTPRVDAALTLKPTTRSVPPARMSGLAWLTLTDDPSLPELERAIAKPEVSAMFQLIHWSRHKFGDAAEIAAAHDKPFIRVPRGYDPNALAKAVLEQPSDGLRDDPEGTQPLSAQCSRGWFPVDASCAHRGSLIVWRQLRWFEDRRAVTST
jgi:hypothetical protein